MIPLIRRLFFAFFLDELAFRRWTRGLLLAFAGGGMAFADSLAGLVGTPDAVKAIKVAAVVSGFIAGAMQSSAKQGTASASEPKEVKP